MPAVYRLSFDSLLCLPVYFCFSMGFQVFVCFTEMLIPKEAIVGREGRRMCRTEYQMLVTVNEGTFLLCITSPKDEYQIFSFFGQDTDGSICKLFPTATLVRTGLVGAYCQGGVQQQDTLFGPSCQVTGGRGWRADIFFYFFEKCSPEKAERLLRHSPRNKGRVPDRDHGRGPDR